MGLSDQFNFKFDKNSALLMLTGAPKAAIGGASNVSDNLDGALSELTTETYSVLYGTIDNIIENTSTNYSIDVTTTTQQPTDGNVQKTGNIDYTSWDPRLSRLDSFLSTNKQGGGSPLIVPFASTTAAGAFFDMVFHIEKGVAQQLAKTGKLKNTETSSKNENIDWENMNDQAEASSQVFMGDPELINSVKNDSDSYGLASIVNPYTLTKLCGGLTRVGDMSSNDTAIDNRLYDIRDKRRFYDRSIEDKNDILSITNPTTTNIITWSNKDPWGRTPYYFQDFVFCKYWNIIPNNRLITLRKYHAPVYDNLQFSSMYTNGEHINTKVVFAPIATVLTYFGEETGNTLSSLLSFTTGTKWKDIESKIHNVDGDMGSNPRSVIDNMFTNGSGFPTGKFGPLIKAINGANFVTSKYFSYGKFIGLLSPGGYSKEADQEYFDKVTQANIDPSDQLYANKIKGPVNRVDSTKARDAGITYDQKLSITCEYIARPIGGVNTKAAMLDILSNCLEIGSVDAMFWGGGYRFGIKPALYPFKNNAFKNRIMDDLYAGRIFGKDGALAHTVEGLKQFGNEGNGNFNWSTALSNARQWLGASIGAIGDLIGSITNSLFGNAFSEWMNAAQNFFGGEENAASTEDKKKQIQEKAKTFTTNLNEMWRTQVIKQTTMPSINGMHALLTGEPVGNWHLTVGNPLNPIMVIGNLVCPSMKVDFGEELGPDDFPISMKITYELEHAMARDKAAIQSMFNRGNGKIYELPDYIRASSDYETKVDNFTGPSTNGSNGWYTPRYMSNTAMLAKGGGGGFQTYKMSPPKELATNAHTDNIFIAKFTPVDVNAAISNIRTGANSFFSANQGSRAWIRGAGVTRKLMN